MLITHIALFIIIPKEISIRAIDLSIEIIWDSLPIHSTWWNNCEIRLNENNLTCCI